MASAALPDFAEPSRFRAWRAVHLQAPEGLLAKVPSKLRADIHLAAQVFPFRVNDYVLRELIDWNAAPDDPMFRLVFPMPEMLIQEDRSRVAEALAQGDRARLAAVVTEIRARLNPHPAGQLDANAAYLNGQRLEGVQHKYHETVLFFPTQGQTCHSYCTFCFRWPQFVGERAWRMGARTTEGLVRYLRAHPEVSDVLITGGDPMVMRTAQLAAIVRALLDPALAHVRTIRIGTKAISYWPYRFTHDEDADDLLRLIEEVRARGKEIAIMAHICHPRELMPQPARNAVRRLRDAGAIIRAQSPVLRWINDEADVWAELWREEVALGIVPYYMFVERDTGAQHYFALPLARCWEIYRDAIRQVSGLARTARGPSMSAWPGKVEVQGVAEVADKRVFVLRMIQARNPKWVQRPFFAHYDAHAIWLDELRPAFAKRFFFES